MIIDFGVFLEVAAIVIAVMALVAAWWSYRKGKRDLELLKRNDAIVQSWIDAGYRIEDDTARTGNRRGRIVRNPNGMYAVAWEQKLEENLKIEG